ncbi:MAG: ASCH domain-containing protein [Planctomycetia bacterium]|nr:ASCH domain-containing protein [Planctomycetia bacterium]
MSKELKDLKVSDTLKAITIHGPWAWAIIQGYKRVENREWETPHRGLLAIHAGKSKDSDQRAAASFQRVHLEAPQNFDRGKIVGTVQLVEILPLEEYLKKYGNDPLNREFAIGPFCWVFEDPEPCTPFRCPGNFQIWKVKNQLTRLKKKTLLPGMEENEDE